MPVTRVLGTTWRLGLRLGFRVRVRVIHSLSCLKRPADPPGPECVVWLGTDVCYTGMPVTVVFTSPSALHSLELGLVEIHFCG